MMKVYREKGRQPISYTGKSRNISVKNVSGKVSKCLQKYHGLLRGGKGKVGVYDIAALRLGALSPSLWPLIMW